MHVSEVKAVCTCAFASDESTTEWTDEGAKSNAMRK